MSESLRMKEMLKQPSTKNWNRAFRQPPLWPPGMLLHHTKLLKSPLLPELLVYIAEASYSNSLADSWSILLPKAFTGCSNLARDCIMQTPKVAGDSLEGKCCIWFSCPTTRNHIEWWHHNLHLMKILFVPSINLCNKVITIRLCGEKIFSTPENIVEIRIKTLEWILGLLTKMWASSIGMNCILCIRKQT